MKTPSQQMLQEVAPCITAPDDVFSAKARAYLDTLTKPIGSLGRLEDLAAQMYAIRQGKVEEPFRKAVYVFAADHGITAEGISSYPSEVTRQMVLNFLSGGAAINVLARFHDVHVYVVDVGVDADLSEHQDLLQCKVRRGTRNMLRESAMDEDEVAAALSVGINLAHAASVAGRNLIAVGEMGIGNTTAASAITAALSGKTTNEVTGRGAGLSDDVYRHKCRVVDAVIKTHLQESEASDPLEILRRVGGLEIAAMAGMMLGCAAHKIPLVVDGFISCAAAAIACALAPATRHYLFAGHQSEEPGHRALLTLLEMKPILNLNMRLGEGTGAVLAMPLIEAALELYRKMATFASAGVSGAKP